MLSGVKQGQDCIIGKDIPFDLIDGEFCRAVEFKPLAYLDKGIRESFFGICSPTVIRWIHLLFIKTKSETIICLLRDFCIEGVIRKESVTKPFALLQIETPKLPEGRKCIYQVINEADFRHLDEAFKEVDLSTQEVIIAYEANPYKWSKNIWLKLLKISLPKLHVYIYLKGFLEKGYESFIKDPTVDKMRIKCWKPVQDIYELR